MSCGAIGSGCAAERERGVAKPSGWGVERGGNTRPDPYEGSLGERTVTSSEHDL